MKFLATTVLLAIVWLAAPVEAQPMNVQTLPPLLTPGLCTKAISPTLVQDVGCAGRTQTKSVPLTSPLLLSNADCGAYIEATNVGAQVTLPSQPPSACTFTFDTTVYNYYINTDYVANPNIWTSLVGYDGKLYQFILPYFPAQSSFYTIQFDGSEWRTAEYSNMEEESFSVTDGPMLANGQVYFKWDSAYSRFELIQRNGPGGLIIDGRMG
jgi:hypothetical protein